MSEFMCRKISAPHLVIALLLCAMPARVLGHITLAADSSRIAQAVRIRTPPHIDGVFDDAVWSVAPAFSGFTQRDPDEGKPPTERTEVQVAYDDDALYVAITAHDSAPDSIVARLVRRDGWTEADRVSVFIDPYHDHQTWYWFEVNAAGSVEDGRISSDGDGWGAWDDTWNGVCEVQVAIHETGWNAEYRIPYHCLRFNPAERYTWGINVERNITRRKERDHWVMVPRDENGFVSRFGHLEGIEGIEPTRAFEFLPYTVGRATLAPEGDDDHRDLFGNLGADVRYGLTSGISLNAAINPDFGQVEADPAQLNLSVFETFQDERRPFFLEGAQDFKTPIQLFYSRRIGRNPGYFELPDGWEDVDRPEFTNIIGAVKITGKTANKTTFGLLEAASAQESARIETTFTDAATGTEQAIRRNVRVEPRANFLIGRVKQDLFGGNSHLGAIATALNRQGAESAYTGGIDWTVKWKDNAYDFSGQIAGNYTETDEGTEKGVASQAILGKRSGWLRGHLWWESFSPGFEVNDLGFQWRNDYYNAWLSLEARRNEPWSVFQRNEFHLNYWGLWNYDNVTLEHGIGFGGWNRLRSFWEFGAWFMHRFRAIDDLDTRGGWPIVAPAFWEWESFVESDSRKVVSGWVFYDGGNSSVGSTWGNVGSGVTIRPSPNIEVRLRPRVSWRHHQAQWVENIEDADADTVSHSVYGRLKSRTLDLTTRVTVLFNRDLSLELYLQPYFSSGEYRDFVELAQPSSYDFIPHPDPEEDPDFGDRSLQSNLVLRWEYRPGSTLFVVWSQRREKSFEKARFRPWTDLGGSLTDDGTNIFLVKLNYWLSM